MIRYNEKKKANEIQLVNIFKSIDGEAFHAGQPTVFVRTFGCNLRCQFCFIRNRRSRRYPFVIMEDGTFKRLNFIQVGDKILTKNPKTNEVEMCTVTNTSKRKVTVDDIQVISIGTSDNNYFAVTKEHPFYTNKWTPAGELKEGDFVKIAYNVDIVKYHILKYRNELIEFSKKVCKEYEILHKDDPDFEAKLSLQESANYYKLFQGSRRVNCIEEYPLKELYGNINFKVYHLDRNKNNDSLDNMILVPRKAFTILTAGRNNQVNVDKPNKDYIRVAKSKPATKWNPSRYKGLLAINLETDAHSFLVCSSIKNRPVLVHNCDTKESWTEDNFNKIYNGEHQLLWMTAQEIAEQVIEMEKDFPVKSVCLTGGEPLMEENKSVITELIDILLKHDFAVNIETDGGIDYKYWKKRYGKAEILDPYGNRKGVTLITDWKLPHSKMDKKMIKSNLEILDENDIIKCVISDEEGDWVEFEKICKSGTKAKLYLSPCFGDVTMNRIPEFAMNHPEYNITCQLQMHKFFWEPTKRDV